MSVQQVLCKLFKIFYKMSTSFFFNFNRVEASETKEYLTVEPTLVNTFSKKCCYEFIPFNFKAEIPQNAVLVRQENDSKIYLGRVSSFSFYEETRRMLEINPTTKSIHTIATERFRARSVDSESCKVKSFNKNRKTFT